jgi:hypothetical protein
MVSQSRRPFHLCLREILLKHRFELDLMLVNLIEARLGVSSETDAEGFRAAEDPKWSSGCPSG